MKSIKNKSQRGITLLALIITIVILIILAVIAIEAINNDNIIAYANNAANRFEDEQKKENTIIGEYESILDDYSGGESDCKHEFQEAVRQATCTEDTKYYHICTKCGYLKLISTDEGSALGHQIPEDDYGEDILEYEYVGTRENPVHKVTYTCVRCDKLINIGTYACELVNGDGYCYLCGNALCKADEHEFEDGCYCIWCTYFRGHDFLVGYCDRCGYQCTQHEDTTGEGICSICGADSRN